VSDHGVVKQDKQHEMKNSPETALSQSHHPTHLVVCGPSFIMLAIIRHSLLQSRLVENLPSLLPGSVRFIRAIHRLPLVLERRGNAPALLRISEVHLDDMPLEAITAVIEALASMNQSHIIGEQEVPLLRGKLECVLRCDELEASAPAICACVGAGRSGLRLRCQPRTP
jgi:hypothetical protein